MYFKTLKMFNYLLLYRLGEGRGGGGVIEPFSGASFICFSFITYFFQVRVRFSPMYSNNEKFHLYETGFWFIIGSSIFILKKEILSTFTLSSVPSKKFLNNIFLFLHTTSILNQVM